MSDLFPMVIYSSLTHYHSLLWYIKHKQRRRKGEWIEFIYHLQDKICEALEEVDGKALFWKMNGKEPR